MQKKLSQKLQSALDMRGFLITLALLCAFPLYLIAESDNAVKLFREGNALYQQGNYVESIKKYEAVLALGYTNGGVFYNLGNAYYKRKKLGYAIFYYEKARAIFGKKADDDTESNLRIAQMNIQDRIKEAPSSLFSHFLGKGIHFFPIHWLSWGTLVSFWILFGFLILVLKETIPIRKSFTYGISSLLSFVCILFSLTLILRAVDKEVNKHAIVLQESVSLKNEPSTSAEGLFIIHEGLKVRVIQPRGSWAEIIIPDGNKGWVEKKTLGML